MRGRRCRGATNDPLGDLARLTATLAGAAALARSPTRSAPRTGRRSASRVAADHHVGRSEPVPAGRAAGGDLGGHAGDAAPLLRLRRYAQGPATPVTEFSSTLNVATTCADVRLPSHAADAVPDRWTLAPRQRRGARERVRAVQRARGDRHVARPRLPALAPLGDTPAGRRPTRCPTCRRCCSVAAWTRARRWRTPASSCPRCPHGRLLTVAGTGHDVLDSDITGCAARALKRFADGLAIGDPCRAQQRGGRAGPPGPVAVGLPRAPGVAGERGRVLFAALDTIVDARSPRCRRSMPGSADPGGCAAGASPRRPTARVRLRDCELVPGLKVSGSLRASATAGRRDGDDRRSGRPGRHAADHPEGGTVTGRIGGRAVRYAPGGRAGGGAAGVATARWAGAGERGAAVAGSGAGARALRVVR